MTLRHLVLHGLSKRVLLPWLPILVAVRFLVLHGDFVEHAVIFFT